MIRASKQLREYAAPSFSTERTLLSAVRELTQRIYEDFTYDPEFSTIATPLHDVLRHKRGVCQDFAHLAIGCLRALGFPARYVSGYLETLSAARSGKAGGGPMPLMHGLPCIHRVMAGSSLTPPITTCPPASIS